MLLHVAAEAANQSSCTGIDSSSASQLAVPVFDSAQQPPLLTRQSELLHGISQVAYFRETIIPHKVTSSLDKAKEQQQKKGHLELFSLISY